jgi:phosphoribosylaminoimidazole carboxylase/phosphoribosylaminoimidazole-succinocarboxamide synthase
MRLSLIINKRQAELFIKNKKMEVIEMEEYKKGELLTEGKTKKIFEVDGNPELCIIQYKDTITKFDDPDQTKEFATKARYSNTTTCRVFELLKKYDIPVAYINQLSKNEFLAPICSMIPFEVVTRRYAYGSYLNRNPGFSKPTGEKPGRFFDIVVELFLKTTKGKLVNSKGKIIVEGLDPKNGEEDPFIKDPSDSVWALYHPKKPVHQQESELREGILASDVIEAPYPSAIVSEMTHYAKKVFLILEKAWKNFGFNLIDMKIEFGFSPEEKLLVADVIDNDSWRLRDQNWEELSKESFRQGEELSKVEEKYKIVASLVEGFDV